MEPNKPRQNKRPEAKIQLHIIDFLQARQWFVKPTVGSAFQAGFPDLFASHRRFKQRWIEVKLPGMVGSKYTAAQIEYFPLFCANGAPVWVMTAASEEEYEKLFRPANWYQYLEIMKVGLKTKHKGKGLI